MVFGVILAGGSGTRMGNQEKPKQFLMLGKKPVLVHTIEKFYVAGLFEKIIVLCPKAWMAHTRDLVEKYMDQSEQVEILEGGNTRNETIMNAIAYIDGSYGLKEDTLIVTHDAVRPFVTRRILQENVEMGKKYGACDTVIGATDTIVCSEDGHIISDIPERRKIYQGQTPQTFRALKLKQLYEELTKEEKEILTDAAKIFVLRGEQVHLVEGEVFNIKITYPYDLKVAETLIDGSEETC